MEVQLTMNEVLSQLVTLAKAQFGEAEYAYFKKHVVYQSPRKRGQSGSHIIPIGDGTPIERSEYEANIEESKRINFERFMGRWPRAYWDFDRKMTKPGWREKLIEMIGALPESSADSSKP